MSEFLVAWSDPTLGQMYDAHADEAAALDHIRRLADEGVRKIRLYGHVEILIETSARIVKRRKPAEKLSPPASETAPIPPSVKDGGEQGGSGALRAASPEGGHDFGGTEGTSFAQRPLALPPEKQQSVKKSKHPDPEKCGVVGCKFDVDKNGRCRDHGPGAVSRG